MFIEFEGEVIEWRGPAPYLFVALPEAESDVLREQPDLSYGWGCVPVSARVGGTEFTTSLMPRTGRYLMPVKLAVQRAEGVGLGDRVSVRLAVEAGPGGR